MCMLRLTLQQVHSYNDLLAHLTDGIHAEPCVVLNSLGREPDLYIAYIIFAQEQPHSDQ